MFPAVTQNLLQRYDPITVLQKQRWQIGIGMPSPLLAVKFYYLFGQGSLKTLKVYRASKTSTIAGMAIQEPQNLSGNGAANQLQPATVHPLWDEQILDVGHEGGAL